MANSMVSASRRLLLSRCRTLSSSSPKPFSFVSSSSPGQNDSGFDDDPFALDSRPEPEEEQNPSSSSSSSSSSTPATQRRLADRPLENGLDAGIYKAILVGMVGRAPVQKTLNGDYKVTHLRVGTGGMRDLRSSGENAGGTPVLWHRVMVYPARLGNLIMNNVKPGSILYLEGNLETNVFTDPRTGLVRRVRDIVIRRNGRLVLLGAGSNQGQASLSETEGTGY